MLLQDLINTFEKLKTNVYIIDRGDKGTIIIRFKDNNFFHLVGLHKTNLNLFIPDYITSKAKIYKYIKKNVTKFNNILLSEIKDNETLQSRMYNFHKALDLLKGKNVKLYNLHDNIPGSLYKGDYGLLKIYSGTSCLLGLVIAINNNPILTCAPQSWMVSKKNNYLIENKRAIYKENMIMIPVEKYDEINNLISV